MEKTVTITLKFSQEEIFQALKEKYLLDERWKLSVHYGNGDSLGKAISIQSTTVSTDEGSTKKA